MPLNNVIILLSALIGSTATLLGAWAYIRSQHPSKGELFRAVLAITFIMASILGLAVLISHATSISINGQQILPQPSVPTPTQPLVPASGFPPPGKPTLSPKSTPALTPSPSASSTPIPAPSPSPTRTPIFLPTPPPASMPSPAPKPATTPSAHVTIPGPT